VGWWAVGAGGNSGTTDVAFEKAVVKHEYVTSFHLPDNSM
jgi:hypothetical protein